MKFLLDHIHWIICCVLLVLAVAQQVAIRDELDTTAFWHAVATEQGKNLANCGGIKR